MNRLVKWLFISLVFSIQAFGQDGQNEVKPTPNDWHLLDRATTGYYGISLDKAYDLLKGKKSQTVTVAVIDSGIDTTHEDLKPILWRNPGEIPGNKTDDDKDGYVDNYYGWNFLGNPDGKNVKQDSYEGARVYWKLLGKFDKADVDTITMTDMERFEYDTWSKAKKEILKGTNQLEITMMRRLLPVMLKGDSAVAKDLNKPEYNGEDLRNYTASTPEAKATVSIIKNIQQLNNSEDITNKQIIDDLEGQIRKADAADTPPEDFRGEIVQDDYNDIQDRFYGNSDVMPVHPLGTHCSGIIGGFGTRKGMMELPTSENHDVRAFVW